MTVETQNSGGTAKLFAILSALACFLLGAIALYSSGIGLIEPKFHRAAGFALALIVGISASRAKREAKGAVFSSSSFSEFFWKAQEQVIRC